MKRQIILIGLCIMLLALVGCEGYLTDNPKYEKPCQEVCLDADMIYSGTVYYEAELKCCCIVYTPHT